MALPIGVARPCKGCGKEIDRKKFCTDDCRIAWYKAAGAERKQARIGAGARKCAETVPCAQCAKPFLSRTSRAKGGRSLYCSKQCSGAARSRPKPEPARQCPDCGATSFRQGTRCGNCQKEHHRKQALLKAIALHSRQARRCGECGKEFTPAYGEKRKVFCSEVCGYKASKRTSRLRRKARVRGVTVELVNPNKVFERDGWRCHLCGKQTRKDKRGSIHPLAPELDHIIPISKGGEHSYANTACSCRKCNATKSDRIIGQPSLLAA